MAMKKTGGCHHRAVFDISLSAHGQEQVNPSLPQLPMFCPVRKIVSQHLVTSYADFGRMQWSMRTVKLYLPFIITRFVWHLSWETQ